MKKNPKKVLSILIPVYNTEKYIERCLDSILLLEVVKDIEVIIVNDGSIDNSVEIIKRYEKKYPKTIVFIDKENGGHGSTINKGIEVATGKYFRVLDSDDWLNCRDFIKFINVLKNEDTDLIVTNYRHEYCYNGTAAIHKYSGLKNKKVYNFDSFNLKNLRGEYFVMATSTYKLDVLKQSNVHLLEKTFYVDMQYNIQSIKNVKNFVYYDLDIYRYFIGRPDQSVNTSSFVKNQISHEKVVKNLIDYYIENEKNYSNLKQKYIEMIMIYMLNTHYAIYCLYETNYENAYYKIKEFDKYLKEKSYTLYSKLNKMSNIKYYRKTHFIFIRYFNRTYKRFYSLILNIRYKLGGKK